MKTKVHFSFDADEIPGEAAAILSPSGCGSDVADVHDFTILNIRTVRVRIELDETDERVAKVFALLQQYGVEFDSYTTIEYSDEDRQNARLLWVGPLDYNDEVYAGLSLGTEYDLTHACPNCQTGAKQISPLYVAHKDLAKIRKHRAIRTMDEGILVDGGLVKKLQDAKVTGISFGDVRARHENGKWSEVARYQILIENVLPPMHGDFNAEHDKHQCTVCRRGGRGGFPKKPYRAADLVGICDFNLTWEWFGEFRTAEHRHGLHRSTPFLFVTPKVMNIFRDAGVKTFNWRPVDIVE